MSSDGKNLVFVAIKGPPGNFKMLVEPIKVEVTVYLFQNARWWLSIRSDGSEY